MPIYVHCGFFYLLEIQEDKIAYLSLSHNAIILVLLRALKIKNVLLSKIHKKYYSDKKNGFFFVRLLKNKYFRSVNT